MPKLVSRPKYLSRYRLPILSGKMLQAYHLLLIVSVCWFANYLHFTAFGYYEDDWYYWAGARAVPWSVGFMSPLRFMAQFFQGRPMVILYLNAAGYLGAVSSSIAVSYVVGFVVWSVTAILLYYVLRMRFPRLVCALVSLFFVLSPLTTMRQSLDNVFVFGPPFVTLFIAILVRRRHPVLAYVLAVLTILTYESVFFLFLAAPLFDKGKLTRRWLRSSVVHLALCVCIIAVYVAVRRAFAEERILAAAEAGAIETAKRLAVFDLRFTLRSFSLYGYAAVVALREASLEALLYTGGFLVWVLMILFQSDSRRSVMRADGSRLARARRLWWIRNASQGLVLILCGYVTAYFQTGGNPGLPVAGRDTRFSCAASVGSSIVAASVLMLLWTLFRAPLLKRAAQALAIVCMALLFIYSFIIQDDYIRAWEYERSFLSQLVVLSPDVEDDTLFLVRTGPQPQPGFGPENRMASVGTQRHGVQVSLQCVSGRWYTAPKIYFVESDGWKKYLRAHADGKLYWTRPDIPGGALQNTSDSVIPGRVILLREHADGSLSRLRDNVIIDGKQLQSPMAPSGPTSLASNWPRMDPAGLLARIVYGAARTMVRGPSAEDDTALPVPDGTFNLAFGRPARQSSTFGPYGAERGVDGKKSLAPSTAFATDRELEPWWQVDLGEAYLLKQARLYNSQPYERAATMRLLLSSDGAVWRVAYDNAGKVFGPAPLIVNLNPTTARYVRLQLAEKNWLHLQEVEVYGSPPEPPEGTSNLALGRPAKQSSTYGQCGAERGVDGIRSLAPFSGFATANEPGPWWQVDLGRPALLSQVRLYNGQPYERAATVRLLLSSDGTDWRVAYDNAGKAFGPAPLIVNLSPTTARFVRLQLADRNWLNLEEVEVYGK